MRTERIELPRFIPTGSEFTNEGLKGIVLEIDDKKFWCSYPIYIIPTKEGNPAMGYCKFDNADGSSRYDINGKLLPDKGCALFSVNFQYWRFATEEEALTRVKPKYPRYFSHRNPRFRDVFWKMDDETNGFYYFRNSQGFSKTASAWSVNGLLNGCIEISKEEANEIYRKIGGCNSQKFQKFTIEELLSLGYCFTLHSKSGCGATSSFSYKGSVFIFSKDPAYDASMDWHKRNNKLAEEMI